MEKKAIFNSPVVKREIYTIQYDESHYIDVERSVSDDCWQAWIYSVDCGIKMHMFGMDMPLEAFIETVRYTSFEYVEIYDKEYNF